MIGLGPYTTSISTHDGSELQEKKLLNCFKSAMFWDAVSLHRQSL